MNDAGVDTPAPGSSSVEAYEEDWYRSLRALAERRRTEVGDVVEEEPAPEDASSQSAPSDDEPPEERGGSDIRTEESAAEPPSPPPIDIWAVREQVDAEAAQRAAREAAERAEREAIERAEAEATTEPPGPWARVLRPVADDGRPHEDGRPIDPDGDEVHVADMATQDVDAVEAGEVVEAGEPAPVADSPTATVDASAPAEGEPATVLATPAEPAGIDEAGTAQAEAVVDDDAPSIAASEGQSAAVEPAESEGIEPVETDGQREIDGEPETQPGAAVETATETDLEAESQPSEAEAAEPAEAEAAEPAEAEAEPEAEPSEAETGPQTEPQTESAAETEPERTAEPEPEVPVGPSLTSRDPAERRTALAELAEREPAAAELDTVAALILDPDAEIRRLAVETLTRTPARLDDAVVRQALQDPADEVRAAAIRAAATRGIRDLPMLAPLVDARRSPETHRTVLELLPKILGEAQLSADAIDPLLLAVAQMQPPPADDEREAFSDIAASIGSTLLIEGLMLPDARRLGAVRLLAGDRSHHVLHALAERAGDPLEEVRRAGVAAAEEIARIEAEAARAAGPPDIGALAEELRNPDPEHVERALSALADVDRADVVAWCRERFEQGDAESVALVASVAAVLDLSEIGVELLARGAALPSERRRPVIEALAEFPDPSRLAAYIAVVPPDRRADAVRLVWEASGRRVLPDLRGLLADPAVDVRVAVIDIARDADDPASIEAVAGLLATDASPEVRAAAVRTIAGSEPELQNVIRALHDPDPTVRATAVEAMPGSPASEVGPALARALTDLDERVRLAAIERLAGVSSHEPALAWSALRQCRVEERTELLGAFQRTNPSQVLDIALEHLYSPDQEERTLAVEMTGWGSSQAAVESAIRALGDPVPEVRRAAVASLGRLRDRSAVAALGKTLADPDPDVRVGAVRALGVIDDEGVLAFLVAALKDPDLRVRETTSHVLTEWSSPAVAKRLAGVLAVPSLRDSAADLLRRIGPTSVELLIDVLIQGSADIRGTVGPLLEQIIGIDEFLGRMDSLEPERRLRAIEALGAIAGPLAVDALTRALSDPDERIRLRATQLLGELGDPVAAEAVRRLVDDPVPEVAAAARYALETNLDSRGHDRPDYS